MPPSLKNLEISNILNAERRCPACVLLGLTELTCLKINCVNGIDDLFLRHLKAKQGLQSCTLMLTAVTGRALKYMLWEDLTFLSIGSAWDDSNIPSIGTAFPKLRDLRLVHCSNVRTAVQFLIMNVPRSTLNQPAIC